MNNKANAIMKASDEVIQGKLD